MACRKPSKSLVKGLGLIPLSPSGQILLVTVHVLVILVVWIPVYSIAWHCEVRETERCNITTGRENRIGRQDEGWLSFEDQFDNIIWIDDAGHALFGVVAAVWLSQDGGCRCLTNTRLVLQIHEAVRKSHAVQDIGPGTVTILFHTLLFRASKACCVRWPCFGVCPRASCSDEIIETPVPKALRFPEIRLTAKSPRRNATDETFTRFRIC